MTVTVQPAYGVVKLSPDEGMATLRSMFPDAQADAMNFCLFSTSGTHGTYSTIEDIEESLETDEPERLTVVIVQPRTIYMMYGHIHVGRGDIAFLKELRASSRRVAAGI